MQGRIYIGGKESKHGLQSSGIEMMVTRDSKKRRAALSELGRRFREAWQDAATVPVPRDSIPANRKEAYIVQDAFAEGLEGEMAGWKVGATSPRMRELDGHEDIILGRLFKSTTWSGSSCEIPMDLFPNSKIEAEFGFELLRDIGAEGEFPDDGVLRESLRLRPSIEIIGLRHEPPQNEPASVRSLLVLADNGAGCGCIAGEPVEDWRGLDLKNLAVGLSIDGGEEADNFLGEFRADPVEVVADLVGHLRGRGCSLKKGDIVLTGAAAVPQPIRKGSKVRVEYPGIGMLEFNCV
ncbi:MAG: hypothetical protein OXN84_01610 [Albidovulum sp.]|nr:hypothetical protein [Albidovulum sp.]